LESKQEIIDFIKEYSGNIKIQNNSNICDDLGIDGDDFFELMQKYSDVYDVNMDTYLWYFHSGEEAHSGLGGLIFKPPYKRVKRIPVTPLLLTQFAKTGKWDIDYPIHKLPKYRLDMILNWIILSGILIFIVWIYKNKA